MPAAPASPDKVNRARSGSVASGHELIDLASSAVEQAAAAFEPLIRSAVRETVHPLMDRLGKLFMDDADGSLAPERRVGCVAKAVDVLWGLLRQELLAAVQGEQIQLAVGEEARTRTAPHPCNNMPCTQIPQNPQRRSPLGTGDA